MAVPQSILDAPSRASAPAEVATIHLTPGQADIDRLSEMIDAGARAKHEQFGEDLHLDDVIPKPWGHEYRAYADDFFDLWGLHIEPGQGTSTHAHVRKLTYLLCLGGRGTTTGLRHQVPVRPGTILRVEAGAFHGTANVGDEPLLLVEIELPRNKFDLMRLSDSYQRAGTDYERSSVGSLRAPLRKVRYLPHARMRRRSPDGELSFSIRTGTDIHYRRLDGDMFHVPLSIAGLVTSDVRITTPTSGVPVLDALYLSIQRHRIDAGATLGG